MFIFISNLMFLQVCLGFYYFLNIKKQKKTKLLRLMLMSKE